VEEALALIAADMRVLQGHDRVFQVVQVDHRHIFDRGVGSRIFHAEARDDLHEMIEQPLRVEPGGSLKIFAKPFLGDIQPEMWHLASLLENVPHIAERPWDRRARSPMQAPSRRTNVKAIRRSSVSRTSIDM